MRRCAEPSGSAFIDNSKETRFTYGAVEQRVRIVGNAPNYGVASILWPANDNWAEGELDYPEGGFGNSPTAYHHYLGEDPGRNCSEFATGVSWSQSHVYRIEWTPKGTSYYVHGRLIGTNTDAIPTTG